MQLEVIHLVVAGLTIVAIVSGGIWNIYSLHQTLKDKAAHDAAWRTEMENRVEIISKTMTEIISKLPTIEDAKEGQHLKDKVIEHEDKFGMLIQRFDRLEAHMDERFDKIESNSKAEHDRLQAHMDERFDKAADGRKHLHDRIDRLTEKISSSK